MADLSVYGKLRNVSDYQDEGAKNTLAMSLAQAQILAQKAAYAKAMQPDIDDLGKQAFLKAAQGQPLNEQESAALVYLDNKSQTASFNPVTGVLEQKPSILDRAGIAARPSARPAANTPFRTAMASPMTQGQAGQAVLDVFGGDEGGAPAPAVAPAAAPAKNQIDMDYESQMAANRGNPRAQQELTNAYNKAKVLPTEDQAKAAGFADRMAISSPIIQAKKEAGLSLTQRSLGNIPLLGNFVTSDDYQSFNQAQRDFINAQLRRESGAAISEGEFANARQQYFPQPGDKPEVLAQKEANRNAVISSMQRSAGASYKPTAVKPVAATADLIATLPMRAVKALRADPTLSDEFDAKYGKGAALRVLRQQ